MSPRPTDIHRTESLNYQMTKGEHAMLEMKAGIEGVSISELVRRAINAYNPKQKRNTCDKCHKNMSYGKRKLTFTLDLEGKKQELTITRVPVKTCECSPDEQTISPADSANIIKLIDLMVLDSLENHKEIPAKMSIEELFGEAYLLKNNVHVSTFDRTETCDECGMEMKKGHIDLEYPLDLPSEKMTLRITGVPAMVCKCGTRTYSLILEASIEEQVDKLVFDALRYRREIPTEMSMDELFEEEYLGKK